MLEDEPIILVQNEVTVNNRFNFWGDVTGESYQFPNGMKGLIKEGRKFIYYRGVHRKTGGRGPAEYLGTGVIGAVEQVDIASYGGGQPTWRCSIEEYVPFVEPVPAKSNGKYLENIAHNQWAKVRRISPELFATILRLAHVNRPDDPPEQAPIFPAIEQTNPSLVEDGEMLLKPRPRPAEAGSSPSGSLRRSKYSKALGDRAEAVALKFLMASLSPNERKSLKWLASMGDKPGWDIQYGTVKNFIAVEVKGTTGMHFPCIELTAAEWKAAQLLRSRYRLILVSQCSSSAPKIEIVDDPYGLFESGQVTAEPLTWRLQRNSISD